jgi:hypothetical protein
MKAILLILIFMTFNFAFASQQVIDLGEVNLTNTRIKSVLKYFNIDKDTASELIIQYKLVYRIKECSELKLKPLNGMPYCGGWKYSSKTRINKVELNIRKSSSKKYLTRQKLLFRIEKVDPSGKFVNHHLNIAAGADDNIKEQKKFATICTKFSLESEDTENELLLSSFIEPTLNEFELYKKLEARNNPKKKSALK